MDGAAREQRERLETIEQELEDVKKRLGRIWQLLETTDIEMADASERIKEHRDRQQQLEIAAEEARSMLAEASSGPGQRRYHRRLCRGDERVSQDQRAHRDPRLRQVLR